MIEHDLSPAMQKILGETQIEDAGLFPGQATSEGVDTGVPPRKPEYEGVSIAKYLYDNIHLLGFDKINRVLNTILRELIDNSQDECARIGVLPTLEVEISNPTSRIYGVRVKDNGPGVPRDNIPQIVGQALYGSKFLSKAASRGQQGLGLKGINLFSLKTTGKPLIILSKTQEELQTTRLEVSIDLETNRPVIYKSELLPADHFPQGHGFQVCAQVKGQLVRKGPGSTPDLIKRYTYLNPTLNIHYQDPEETLIYPRLSDRITKEGASIGKILTHQEPGEILEQMRKRTTSVRDALLEIYYGTPQVMDALLRMSRVHPRLRASCIHQREVHSLLQHAPSCFQKVVPPQGVVGTLNQGVMLAVTENYQKHYQATAEYRSKPIFFGKGVLQVQVCGFYGGGLPLDQKIQIHRVANCSPLTYLASSCLITKTVAEFNWKPYSLDQSPGQLPRGPLLLLVHVSASKVPYTGPGKDAIADDSLIAACILQGLRVVGKAIRRYRHREELKESRMEKLQVITRTLPELIRVLAKGLSRQVIPTPTHLQALFAKVMDSLLMIQIREGVYKVINGSKLDYEFKVGRLGINPDEYRVVLMRAQDTTVVEFDPVHEFFEGLNPEEYVMLSKKQWLENIQGIEFSAGAE